MERRSLLRNVYLFSDFSDAELGQIEEIALPQTHAGNVVLFKEGQDADSLLIIKHGSVQIAQSGDNNTVMLAMLGSGAHFGEMSLLDAEPRSATARTLEDSELVVVPYAKLRELLDTQPAIAAKFYRALAMYLGGRLRATSSDLNFARNRKR
ncbi:cyclic nucleotide-binding domain-containing protein [Sinimarinibacterium thermocellulolyticum]|uniref:Cyclic nucleotide-binding domain-containing protein n=1 Tax=Sinimarinibacterium thermocellulolyticum TaxID=3170016 RepID=A0ABV2ABH4_9GAMM